MKILITGSNGYIGTKLANLIKAKHQVVYFDKQIDKDVLNQDLLDEVFRNNLDLELVIHLSALAGVEKNSEENLDYFNNNIKATFNLLEAMRKNNVKNILFASSCSVYGSDDSCSEKNKLNPESFYGLTKVISENLIKFYSEKYQFKYNIFRLFNVVGNSCESEFNNSRIMPTLINKINKGELISLFLQSNGKDTCIRDYVDIEFVCKIFIKFLSNPTNNIYNIGSGKGYSGKKIADKLFSVLNKKTKIKYSKKRNGDPDVSISNNKKIKYSGRRIDQIIKEYIK